MSMRIELNERNKAILESIFRNAPKTYEEALAKGKIPPIPVGRKHKDDEIEKEIIYSIIDKHEKQLCDCNESTKCLFVKLKNKEISTEEAIKISNQLRAFM
ncbi:MAG: hypothetical protein HQK63_15880 [Desulfamplus sp.]|nr:hypothetical protein [Desulfamplus sp.]